MRLTVSANLNGRWETKEAATYAEAAEIAADFHSAGANPVRWKRDDIDLDDADERDRLISEEAAHSRPM